MQDVGINFEVMGLNTIRGRIVKRIQVFSLFCLPMSTILVKISLTKNVQAISSDTKCMPSQAYHLSFRF